MYIQCWKTQALLKYKKLQEKKIKIKILFFLFLFFVPQSFYGFASD